jgi:uncharacterized protein
MDEGLPFGQGYELQYTPEGVFLKVNKPYGTEPAVTESDVLDEVRRLRIHSFVAAVISEAVKKAEGRPVKIAEAQQQERVDAQIEVIASPDKMKAFLYLRAPVNGGSEPSRESLAQALREKGVLYGIDTTALEDLARYPVYGQNILIAQGTPSVNGKNGFITWKVDLQKDRKPTIREDGTVDYKDMNIIESVTKGQVLAVMNPPVPGLIGHMVTGTEMKPLDGKPAVFSKGRNVVVSPDGMSLLSDIDGQILYADGKISVFATYEVKADVDNSTGNINVVGNVSIRGNVLAGFMVEAGGNVEVEGVVEGATIRAGGDIILKRGMIGNNKGQLTAGGDIIAKYIENATLEAKGDIRSEAIMHSDVKCGGKLELGGKKGLLIGGVARVGREVEAKVIGSVMSTVTVLEVGVDPHLRERLKFLRSEIPSMEENLTKSNQAITLLKKMDSAAPLTDDRREMLAKSTRSKFFYESRLMEYRKEMLDIEARLQQDAAGRIRVLGAAHNGVRVSIGSCSMYVKESLQYCTLYRDGADVRVGPL